MYINGLDGQKLGISNDQIKAIVNTYATGTYVGGLKISTYMQTVYNRGLNLFNPSRSRTFMARVLGWRQREWKEASRGNHWLERRDKDSGRPGVSLCPMADGQARTGFWHHPK